MDPALRSCVFIPTLYLILHPLATIVNKVWPFNPEMFDDYAFFAIAMLVSL